MKDDEFNPYMKFHGLFVPNGIAMSQIPAQAKLLLGRLLQYSGNDGRTYPTRKKLSKELGNLSISTIDKNIRTLKNLKLIRTYPLDPENKQSPSLYAFLKNPMYDDPLVKNNSTPAVKNNSTPAVKNDSHNRISNNRINVNNFSKEKYNDSCESSKKGNCLLNKKRTLPRIIIKKKPIDISDRQVNSKKPKKDPKSKYNHSIVDLRNYSEAVDAGALKHTKDKTSGLYKQAGLNTIDKLYLLLSPKSKKLPYDFAKNITSEYVNFNWTIDDLLDAFKFQLKYTKIKQVRNIGDFIFTKGFNGNGSWSPLIKWHTAMKKGITGELTEEGKKLFKSFGQKELKGIQGLDSDTINKMAKDVLKISSKYVFMENERVTTMTYGMGIISVVSEYIKEKQNATEFEWYWITKKKFIEDEFLTMAKKRNILKKKSIGWNVNK